MIDVIEAGTADIQFKVDQIIEGGEHVLMGERAHRVRNGQTQLLVDLVAANPAEVVTLGIKEPGLKQLLTTTHRGGFPGAQFLVELKQRLVLRADAFVVGGINRLLVELRMAKLVKHIVV